MTTATPYRLAVLLHLTTLLEGVNPSNGYVHDLRDCVFRGRILFGEKDPLPLVSILDQPLPTDPDRNQADNPVQHGDYPLVIQGFVKDDLDNPTDPAHLLFAEVRKALADEKKNKSRPPNLLGMGGLVTKLDIGLGTVRPPEAGISNKAFFWQIITLGIVEKLDDPYGYAQQT